MARVLHTAHTTHITTRRARVQTVLAFTERCYVYRTMAYSLDALPIACITLLLDASGLPISVCMDYLMRRAGLRDKHIGSHASHTAVGVPVHMCK